MPKLDKIKCLCHKQWHFYIAFMKCEKVHVNEDELKATFTPHSSVNWWTGVGTTVIITQEFVLKDDTFDQERSKYKQPYHGSDESKSPSPFKD